MSDPRYTDPRLTDPPLEQERNVRDQRLGELEQSNAMWGWIAGGVVLALLLVFIFGRSPTTDTASTDVSPPASSTTGMAPPRNPAPPAQPNRPSPPAAGQSAPQTPPPSGQQ
jgi:hypothetical protein